MPPALNTHGNSGFLTLAKAPASNCTFVRRASTSGPGSTGRRWPGHSQRHFSSLGIGRLLHDTHPLAPCVRGWPDHRLRTWHPGSGHLIQTHDPEEGPMALWHDRVDCIEATRHARVHVAGR